MPKCWTGLKFFNLSRSETLIDILVNSLHLITLEVELFNRFYLVSRTEFSIWRSDITGRALGSNDPISVYRKTGVFPWKIEWKCENIPSSDIVSLVSCSLYLYRSHMNRTSRERTNELTGFQKNIRLHWTVSASAKSLATCDFTLHVRVLIEIFYSPPPFLAAKVRETRLTV